MKQAIRAAGAVAFEVRTTAPSDFVTSWGHRGGYILSARDLITNDIEAQVEGALLDGMVCLASCDKTPPGQLMAAGRLNIPTLIFCCGYQPSGQYNGHLCDIEDVFATAGGLAFGKVSIDEIKAMGDVAIRGPGVCAGMGTANTLHAACEALGMSLPGSTPILANSDRMWEFVEQAAKRIVAMVDEDLKPRDILTAEAFENAVMVMLCVSGSINSAKHLAAIAQEAGCDVDIYKMFETYADVIPLLTAVRPNGDATTEAFEAAGGTQGVMKQLERLMKTGARTVTGKTLGENLAGFKVADEETIRPVTRPLGTHPTIVMLRGSLSPETSIVKLSVTEQRNLQLRGPAVVFETALEAIDGIQGGKVSEGQVVVVRGLGPKGTPGMGVASVGGVRRARGGACRQGRRGHRRSAFRPDERRHHRRRGRAGSRRRRADRPGRERRHHRHRRREANRRSGGVRSRARKAPRKTLSLGDDQRTRLAGHVPRSGRAGREGAHSAALSGS